MSAQAQAARLQQAEKRLSEIERLLRGYGPTPKSVDYVSRGDWFPTDSDALKERGNDHPRRNLKSK
jgi:hypothetical protein